MRVQFSTSNHDFQTYFGKSITKIYHYQIKPLFLEKGYWYIGVESKIIYKKLDKARLFNFTFLWRGHGKPQKSCSSEIVLLKTI